MRAVGPLLLAGLLVVGAPAARAAWPEVPAQAAWSPLTTEPVAVACATVDGLPWCRASALIDAPLAALRAVVLDFDRYPERFPRIHEVRALAPDVKYLRLDLPSPLADRDYCARFRFEVDAAAWFRVSWFAVRHEAAPPVEGVVRLNRAAGAWELVAGPTGTRVVYTWEGELEGALEDWMLARARGTTGAEVIGGLANAVGRTPAPLR